MATVAIPSDVRPALPDTSTGNAGQQAAADWVAALPAALLAGGRAAGGAIMIFNSLIGR